MQEARNVVSSPRWQNTVDVTSTSPAAATEEKRVQADETAAAIEAKDTQAKTSNDDAAAVESTSTDTETRSADDTADKSDDTATETVSTYSAYTPAEPPMTLLRGPLLTITTVCALAAAMWSYTTLEDTRARLASVTDAQATLEKALTDAKAKLATAEKTVADVKAAISAASAAPAAAAGKTAATK